MRRLLPLLAAWAIAFAPVAAAAQGLTLLGVGTPGGAAAASYSGPGDIVGSAKGWWGLRAYTAAIASGGTTVAVKIIRSSDSHTCDVLLNSTGGLGNTSSCSTGGENGTAVATWCNATTCKIDTWYDQTGNSNSFTQSTDSKRATLTFSCIGSLPCATFSGSQVYAGSMTSTSMPMTLSTVAIRTGAFTTQNDLLDGNEGFFFNNAANQAGGWFGNVFVGTASDSAWHAMQIVAHNGSSTAASVAIDATQTTGLNSGSIPLDASPYLGGQDSGPTTAPLNGKIAEIGLWGSTAFTGTQMTNMCHNQYTYWGTPTSC